MNDVVEEVLIFLLGDLNFYFLFSGWKMVKPVPYIGELIGQ